MPITNFAIKDPYTYLSGFGGYHQSEALPGAAPKVQNTPQRPPLGLTTERISGSSFTAPRAANQQVWLYRIQSSLERTPFVPIPDSELLQSRDSQDIAFTPNNFTWTGFKLPKGGDFVSSQHVLAETGNPAEKTGMAYLVYSATQDMPKDTVYFNSDGSDLIIAQCGALDIQTELGRMLVRPMEIAVLPRGIRYRVTLPDGHARGYICSLYQGAWQLPELGPIGSCSLANVRDFEVPTAHFEGHLDASTGKAVDAAPGKEWTVLTRFVRRLCKATQKHSPFDVVAWHGTYYPYKYDLAKFSVLGSVLFDHPDPSIFTVLTAPSHRIPGHAVVDFAVFPPRYAVMEDTYYLPYYHRNSLSEFAGAIIRPPANPNQKDEMDAFWQAPGDFKPLGASLNNSMVTHGSTKEQHEHAMERSTAPEKIDDHPFMIFLLEAENMMGVSSWAGSKAAGRSWREKKGKAEGEGSKL